MKIFLIDLGDGSHSFCPEEAVPSPAGSDEVQGKRIVRWFARKLVRLEDIVRNSERGIGPHIHRTWEWLKRRTFADESFLRRLRYAAALAVYHPASLPESDARHRWARYLAQNRGRHLFWLVVNVLICPFTLLLVPLPGPNIIGFWFLYRTIAHLLALLGVLRARSSRIETRFHAVVELDPEAGETVPEWIDRVAARYGLQQLRQSLSASSERNSSRSISAEPKSLRHGTPC